MVCGAHGMQCIDFRLNLFIAISSLTASYVDGKFGGYVAPFARTICVRRKLNRLYKTDKIH